MVDNNTIIHSTLDEGYDFFITDKWGNEKHFKIATFVVPSGLLSEAFEVIESNIDDEPRVFHILSNYDSDLEKAELQLKEKIKKGINKRYLENKDGVISILDGLEIAGRILWDENLDYSNFDYFFQVDGEKITIEKFVELLKGVEGWNFKFKIIDTTDDID
ncbi:MAG: hypothetical protein JXR48_13745 [Candidatus Delongbacteria bacterium]|nr:hypothetical protein [Candidatus Delongbacteria bacterium]